MTNILTTLPDDWYAEPTEEEEREYWAGEGTLTFTVLTNRPNDGVLEVEVEDYTGCLGGFDEGIGIEWGLGEGYLGIDREDLKEGYKYYLSEITVSFTRGDGWMTDDDSEYYVESVRAERLPLFSYLKLIIHNAWWFNFGWKIRQWRNS